MLGRKNYTREELDRCRAAIGEQFAAYEKLTQAAGKAASPAVDAFEPLFFNNLTLVLDRYFVHRLRIVTGKDGNVLNEVEMICDSLIGNEGVLRASNVIKYVPEQSVVKLNIGDQIRLSASDFERLSAAFFAEIERKFL
ncbi:MAG: hypothetical protein AUI14_08265 [Actinobacteria bacterium 13_2_20CM_2_71_6]|nr:MAG: hypothetical protein AUI14_08265 [Actinobacteria bacterium 13_2_20CM_2_71_6]